jgi:rod shape-determining protein MreC
MTLVKGQKIKKLKKAGQGEGFLGNLFIGKVKTADLSLFSKKISTMIRAGLPILDSFKMVEEQTENKRLKLVVEDYVIESDSIYAKVLSDKNSPFLKSIIINKGSKHGINRGSVVKDNQYLVGKIVEVNYTTSRVLLLSDINSKIPVLIEPQGLLSILSGDGDKEGVIQYSKVENIIEDTSIVYTSGVGGLLKAGIPVGKIAKSSTANLNGKVQFFSDFSQLKFVEVLFFERKISE